MNFCSYCNREPLYSSPIVTGVFYCRVSSLMTDQTDRLASTVINLVLPEKVCNSMPKGLGNMLSFAACRGKKELIPASLFHPREADIYKRGLT